MKILNVVYESNDAYAMISGTSMVSLLENNQHLDEINIYYLAYRLTKNNISKLQKLVAAYKNAKLVVVDAEEYNETFKQLGVRSWRGIYITWLKLLAFGDLDINTDRLLFINGHTIINGKLDELIDLDFEGNMMALSYDCLLNEHKATLGLTETDGYYNCGLMLVNQDLWKKEDMNTKVKEHLAGDSDYVIVDQDFCNVFFKDRIKLLGVTYNFSSAYYGYDLKTLLEVDKLTPEYFYSYEEIMANYYDPKIIHSLFGVIGKPWEEGTKHPNRFLWDKYIAMTPWKDARRPKAKYTRIWFLYDVLPQFIFMRLYRYGMYRLYGR